MRLPAAGLAFLLTVTPAAADVRWPQTADLAVIAQNVRSSQGVVGVLVFREAAGWPENPQAAVFRKAVPARPGAVRLEIPDVPPGVYALVVLHDENENMKADRNWAGKPREGWGMSNNPKARMRAPSFQRARFTVSGDTVVRVRLNY